MGANLNLGVIPVDMTAPYWGLDEFVSDADPQLSATPTSTEIHLLDPVTGVKLHVTGTFDVGALLLGDLSTSSFTEGEMYTPDDRLIFHGEIDPPVPLAILYDWEGDIFPLFLTGDDTVAGSTGNDTLDGGPGSDVALFGGTRSEYTIQGSGTALTVSGGPEGTDTLYAFEYLQFADQTIGLVPLPPPFPPPEPQKYVGFLFDEVYYLLANPDLVGTVTPENALNHYLTVGAAESRDPNSWFDPDYYSNRWDDLKTLNLDDATLFMHYNLYGVWEGRSAGPKFDQFDGDRYLSDWPDVAAYVDANLDDFLGSRTNGAIAHFVIYGADEQRWAYDTTGALVDMGYVI